ncbi:MAG: hypothetical protein J6Y02_03700 [Pseudobutyrivibrio sp.]|nr:hypothetical protein [Pseudobutyrivibrio sp.]
MTKYMICGYVNPELCVEIGEFETRHKLTEVWQLIIQIFQDGNYPEGIIARRIK